MANPTRGLYKRNGIYWSRYADADGKILRRSLGTRNGKEAEKKLVRLKDKVYDERLGIAKEAPKQITFADFSTLFLDKHARHKASFRDDDQRARDYLIPALGDLKVHQIDSKRVAIFKSAARDEAGENRSRAVAGDPESRPRSTS